MSEKLEKYVVRTSESYKEIQDDINDYHRMGYKLHSLRIGQIQGEHIVHPHYVAVLNLPSSASYDNIERLQDVEPQHVDEMLEQGWLVADSYSKFIRMVKKSG